MKKLLFWTLLLGLILRLISLNQSLWLDEATSALVVRNFNFGEIVSKFTPGDFHPPFYYLLLKAWSLAFGTSEIALRMPSVIFGLLTVYLVFLIGRELINKKTGLVAAILLATSGLHVYYSQEARMYSLITFLVALSVFLFVKILKRGRLGDFFLFAVVLAVVVASDYVAGFIFLAFWIYVIIFRQNKSFYPKFIASHIILLVVVILWFPVFVKQLGLGMDVSVTSSSWWNLLGTFSLKNVFLIPVKFVLGRIGFDNKVVYGLIASFALILFGIPLWRSLKNLKKSVLVWLWLLVPIVLGVIVSFRVSILSYFRFIFCLPALYLLCAIGLSGFKSKFRNLFLLVMVLINVVFSGIYLFNPRFQRENWRGLVSFAETQKTAKSVTLFVADSNMEAYRYYDSNAKISGPKGLNNNFDQVWLMRYLQPVFDSSDSLRAKIEASGYNKEGEYDFNGVVVWKYSK